MTSRVFIAAAVLSLTVAGSAGAQLMTLTQSVDNTTVLISFGLGCHAAGIVSEQSYWRSYDLPTEGVTTSINLVSVTYGLERSVPGAGFAGVPIDVRIYLDLLPQPPGATTLNPANFMLLHTESVMVPQQFAVLQTVNLSTPINFSPNDTIVVEIHNADGTPNGHSFFIGGNGNGQTQPNYFSAPGCGTTVPTDTQTIVPGVHNIIDLNYMVPNQVIDYPGSGDDLVLSSAIGLGMPLTHGAATDIKQALPGDVLAVNVASPMGAYDIQPYFLLTQIFATGSPVGSPVPGFPEIHFDPLQPIFILVDGGATGPLGFLNLLLPGTGNTTLYVVPAGLSTLSIMLQGLVPSAMTNNGFFAMTDGHEIQFQ